MIKKKIFIVVIGLLIHFACNDKKNIVHIDKFQEIFKDLVKISFYDDTYLDTIRNRDSLYWLQYNGILKKHNITDTVFRDSYEYYLSNFEKYKTIIKFIEKDTARK